MEVFQVRAKERPLVIGLAIAAVSIVAMVLVNLINPKIAILLSIPMILGLIVATANLGWLAWRGFKQR